MPTAFIENLFRRFGYHRNTDSFLTVTFILIVVKKNPSFSGQSEFEKSGIHWLGKK